MTRFLFIQTDQIGLFIKMKKNLLLAVAVVMSLVVPFGIYASFSLRAVNDNQIRWKDINIGANILSGPPGQLPDVENFLDETGADTGIATIGIDVGEATGGMFEIQHDYKEGTDIFFHTHWQGQTAPGGGTDNVQWELTYTIAQNGDTLDPVTVIVTESAVTTQYGFNFSDFAGIDGTSLKIGNQFVFTLERIAASADEYAGDAVMATIGIHYQIDDRGSSQISSK